MRGRRELTLVLGVTIVSMLLTLLTVWAVYEQGAALLEREWSDWRGKAAADAAKEHALFRSDAQRACDAVTYALERGGLDEVDQWAARPSIWALTLVNEDGSVWSALPLTPCETPLPVASAESEALTGATTRPVIESVASRVGKLVAAASRGERSGPPSAVVRVLTEAGSQLVARPGYVRLALCAELVRIDALIDNGENARAAEALLALQAGTRSAHSSRFGPSELDRIERIVVRLANEPAATRDALQRELVPLRARVRRREAIAIAVRAVLANEAAQTRPTSEELALDVAELGDGEPITIVRRTIGASGVVALAVLESDLYRTYMRPPKGAAWQLRRGSPPSGVRWLPLAAPFASAAIVPSADVEERFASLERRRLLMLCATAGGTGGGWAIVCWLMLRAIARQREYLKLQNRFVADISHELKTPLAMIRLLSETLLERRVNDPERVRRYHETITRESERLTALLDNILDIGRVESGRKTYTFEQCDLAEVARRAWVLFEPQFARDGFDAHFEVADDLPRIRADGAALQQVLVNLLQNAHRYGGQGKFVRLGLKRQEHVLLMEVEDHGIGMTRSELNRLGQTFFRADDSRVRQQRGTGLGLAIVKHIVSAHQGKVEVHSRPNQGTRFTVWLPIETAAAGG